MSKYDEFASESEYQPPGSEDSNSKFNDHLLAVYGKQKENKKKEFYPKR